MAAESIEMLHAGDESISLARDGHEEIVLVRTLAERPPQRRNLTSQVVLIHRRFRPHAVEKLVLGDGAVPALEEDDQYVEGLRRDGDEAAVSPQPPFDGIGDERTEGVATDRTISTLVSPTYLLEPSGSSESVDVESGCRSLSVGPPSLDSQWLTTNISTVRQPARTSRRGDASLPAGAPSWPLIRVFISFQLFSNPGVIDAPLGPGLLRVERTLHPLLTTGPKGPLS